MLDFQNLKCLHLLTAFENIAQSQVLSPLPNPLMK